MISEDLKPIVTSCMGSTKVTAKVMFPERFYSPFASLHDQLFKVLDDDSIRKVVVVAPRGFGKTSIMNLAFPAKKLLFREKKFIVPISNTSTQAVMQSENLKRELMSNKIVRSIFGSMGDQSRKTLKEMDRKIKERARQEQEKRAIENKFKHLGR